MGRKPGALQRRKKAKTTRSRKNAEGRQRLDMDKTMPRRATCPISSSRGVRNTAPTTWDAQRGHPEACMVANHSPRVRRSCKIPEETWSPPRRVRVGDKACRRSFWVRRLMHRGIHDGGGNSECDIRDLSGQIFNTAKVASWNYSTIESCR